MSAAACRPYLLRPPAAAEAAAVPLGLSKSHIRPSPTVTFYVGGTLVRFDSRSRGVVTGHARNGQRFRSSLKKADNVFGYHWRRLIRASAAGRFSGH